MTVTDAVATDRSTTQRLRDWARTTTDRLLADRRPAWPAAIARIVFGVTLVAWTVSMMVDASPLLADDGPVGPRFARDSFWPIDLDTTAAAWVALVVLLLTAVAITIGFRPTVFLLVAFVLLVQIQRRNPLVLNSGDLILRNLSLLLALAPTGAALSVDRWRRYGRAALRSAPLVAPWGLRLVQLQLIVVYFFAFWGKSGELWRNGTAVSTALRLVDLQRFGRPDLLVESIAIVALLTWGTLLVELALASGLWVKRARPALIVLGILLHLSIDSLLLVGFFGLAMISGLMTFLDADRVDRFVRRRSGARGDEREPEPDLGTATGDVGDPDLATVAVDDLRDDRQPQP